MTSTIQGLALLVVQIRRCLISNEAKLGRIVHEHSAFLISYCDTNERGCIINNNRQQVQVYPPFLPAHYYELDFYFITSRVIVLSTKPLILRDFSA